MSFVLRPPGEVLSLPDQLRALARQRQWVTAAAGLFISLAFLLVTVAVAGTLDAALHFHPAIRAVVLLALLAGTAVLLYRGFWLPIRRPMRPLGMALMLEDRFPRLNDSLASAIEFEGQPAVPGSERFRTVATKRAAAALEKCDTSSLVPSGRALANFGLLGLAAIVALPFALFSPQRTQVALLRLADPYGEHFWPTRTKLELLEPTHFPLRIAKGEPLDLRMKLGGVLPDRVVVAVRFENGQNWEEIVPVPEGYVEVECPARLDASRLQRDFQFQIRANDAVTPWLAVAVAEPPKLVPFDGRPSPQLRATYPEYTRLTALDLPDGATVVEAIAGTRFRFRAATDRRIATATLVSLADRKPWAVAPALVLQGGNPLLAYAGAELVRSGLADIPVAVTGSGANELVAEFTPTFAGLYSLRFTDETGITGTRLFDFRLLPDPAPLVTLDEPLPNVEPLILLPTASLTVLAKAEDRTFAVRRLTLEYRTGDDAAGWSEIVLNDPARFALVLPAAVGSMVPTLDPQFNVIQGGESFPLTRLGAVPGQRLTVRAAAVDYDDITACKAPGRSREVEIRVVNAAGLDGLLQRQLADLRPRVLKLREEQRQARERLEENVASPGPDAGAKHAQLERDQQAIRNRIIDPQDGLKARAAAVQELIRRNALPKSPTTDRVEAVAGDLAKLGEQTLEGIESKMGAARKSPSGEDAKKAVAQQKLAEQAFDRILEQLERWGGAGESRAEAQALKDALAQAANDAARAAEKVSPGKPGEELSPAEKSTLAKPAEKLNQLADRTAGALGKAERQAAEKEQAAAKAPGTPEAETSAKEAAALRDAVRNSGGQQLVEDIRTAAKQLERNAPAKSAEATRAAMDKLNKFTDALSEKAPEAGDQLEKKRKTADAIDQLAEEQDQLAKKAKAAEDDPEALKKLAGEQEALRKKVEAAAEKLNRDREAEAAEKLRNAAEKMAAAQAALEEGKAPAEQQNQALEKIEEAVNKLDRDRAKDEEKLAKEAAAKLADQLKAIRDRLAAADAEAVRLQMDVLKVQAWDRGKIASLGDLDERIRSVADDLRKFTAANFEPLPVFKQLAEQSAETAERSARRFADRKGDVLDAVGEPFDAAAEAIADDRCRRPLKTAIRRLDHILEALKEEAKKPAPMPNPVEKPEMPENPPMPMPMGEQPQPPTAQIKALRSLQAELNERTTAFAKAHPDRMKLTTADREELDELERSQREVAELFQKIASSFKPAEK